ncbi:ammonium transporter Rh type A-like [Mizuhopecten yessoensis]|uniref:Ammonium transporter Rh type B-B n=1 Tax=Mizuhopecten yessoensis TaxID=6573 RepID=A0A210QWL7_MIZYE|nr:ammonium transporter Rh type A-like [Mizuhopecten yessoensis]OWF53145.1 Ammonium transporter Rh type B-B [Mizuhopecten yessoensis]
MSFARRGKFTICMCIIQVIFIIVFGVFADYDPAAKPRREDKSAESTIGMYPMFQDVHVMIFIGFGFLMTFLKRYGYSAVSVNLFIAAVIIQWALIVRGVIHQLLHGEAKFTIGIGDLLGADFAAATVLISFGAVLGKTSPLQLIVMGLIEVVLSQINEYIGLDKLRAEDVGESMYIHAFGAYFGLAASRVLFSEEIEKSSSKEGAVYHSDIFSMVGTVFLWIYWPSFNGGAASGDEQHRAIVNTYLSLAACTVVTFAFSMCVDKSAKFDMVHIQNATLAGGVAVGTTANMPLDPWGAMLIGSVAGIISVLGYKFFTPFLASKLKIHDTCGVNNLHGMPGILAGVAGACAAALANYDKWGESLFEIFPGIAPTYNSTDYTKYHDGLQSGWSAGLGRTSHEQGGYQFAALGVTLVIAIVGGALTGLLMKLPLWDNPRGDGLFDDGDFFEVAEQGFPSSGEGGMNGIKEDTRIHLMEKE